jgi:hypothetical protein
MDNIKMYQFELIVRAAHGVMNHYVYTDVNLLELYKNSFVVGTGVILWETGAIDKNQIVGIFDRTPPKVDK